MKNVERSESYFSGRLHENLNDPKCLRRFSSLMLLTALGPSWRRRPMRLWRTCGLKCRIGQPNFCSKRSGEGLGETRMTRMNQDDVSKIL